METTPLAEIHRAAGAALEPYFGVQLPAQFADPLQEYRSAREHVAVIDTNFRSVFSLSGPDRVRYLNAILTSNIRDLAAGQGAIGLLLNVQGHILAELIALALADRLLILGHASIREKTFATLDKFIIMDDATLTDETEKSGTLALEGPRAPEIISKLAGVDLAMISALSHVQAELKFADSVIPCRIIRHSLFGFPGAELLVARESLVAAWNALSDAVRGCGGAPIGYRALNMLRLEAGVPWFGVDFDENQIPHEAALEKSHISYTKGCYTGQEIVERVRSRGHVNRRRTELAFASAVPPLAGAKITAGEKESGHVTSAAFSPLAGKPIGMGYLRREFSLPGTVLECAASSAEIISVPLAAQRTTA
jgi:aminomethyltransferase